MSYNDDMFTGWLGIGTQIDSLAHLGIDGRFYNGNHSKDFVKVTGVTKLGIEKYSTDCNPRRINQYGGPQGC